LGCFLKIRSRFWSIDFDPGTFREAAAGVREVTGRCTARRGIRTAPFKLAKDPTNLPRVAEILAACAERVDPRFLDFSDSPDGSAAVARFAHSTGDP
jgi:hypothetical protein